MPNYVEAVGADPAAGGEISSAAEPAADVLIDRLQLGLDLLLPVKGTPSAAVKFCRVLARAGFLARTPQSAAILDKKLSIGPVSVRLPGGGAATLGGRLDLVASKAGQLQVRRTSNLLPNPMRALRTMLPNPMAEGPGGDDNLAAPFSPGAYAALLPLQLGAVSATVDAFMAALADAAGVDLSLLRGRVWVQQVEFCLDFPHEAAEDFVRRLRDRPIRGARHERGRYFADQRGNALAVSWHDGGKNSPERKAYAKRQDIVRVEVSLRSRAAVTALLKSLDPPRAGPSLRGADVAAELARLARGAETLLGEAVDALNEGLEAVPRTGANFVLAFAPLLRLISPPTRAAGAPGRPRGAGVEPLASLALERLLAEGKFDMRGKSASSPVLVALKEMQAAGALAVAARQPRLFTVAPDLEAARQALAGVLVEPLSDGPE